MTSEFLIYYPAMADNDYSKLIKPEFAGQWIALSSDRTTLLGHARTLKALTDKHGKKGIFYTQVMENGLYAF